MEPQEMIIDESLNQTTSTSNFIEANTKQVSLKHLRDDTIIPVFSKDNEMTMSHHTFIETAQEAILKVFPNIYLENPDIRVSHIVKGRVPSAIGKPVKELLPHEKTIYYERMAFMLQIPEVQHNVNGNMLALTIGGVRAYNHENLYSKKSMEKFKVFIGFKNMVCTNLCISTDGFKDELRASNTSELLRQMIDLFLGYDHQRHLGNMERLSKFYFSAQQMAHLLGRLKMYQYLPLPERKRVFPIALNDGQINAISKGYFTDHNFSSDQDGNINLWDLYNLFTGAVKSSYIDSFLKRECQAFEFSQNLANDLQYDSDNYFLLPQHE
ncbi:DUF3871 family protein [Lutimonas saemankumensis]|uniref:DUF3871 family protein n=1 Tax=Lutimonas saemankumensis TaxID=483016 RepID=UPI001CD5FF39|nr:DUF3871 family protein [Lutimonas saemankumensis]MCA0933251.1 DUF3871 family protein [Lutimonas saemankumensis]